MESCISSTPCWRPLVHTFVAFAEQAEIFRQVGLVVGRMRRRHCAAIGRDFAFILNVLSGKAVRLIIQEERSERVRGEWSVEELLTNRVQTFSIREDARPF